MRRLLGYVKNVYYSNWPTKIWMEYKEDEYRILLMTPSGLHKNLETVLSSAHLIPVFTPWNDNYIIVADISKLLMLLLSISDMVEFRPSTKFKRIFEEFNDDELNNEYMLTELQQ